MTTTSDSTSDRSTASASYAAEVARLLWPAPWGEPTVTRSHRRPAAGAREVYVFPSPRNPRLLVPADLPAAATMVKRLGNDRSSFVGPMRTALQASVRSPLFALARWPRLSISVPEGAGGSIESHLAGVLGTEVRVGVVLGPRRVNQKPVLQVFGLDGRLLGFAKVGHNALTAALVRREAAALQRISDLAPRHFRAPRLLDAGTWNGLDVLVMSPLTVDPAETVTPATRAAAMLELATLGGTTTGPLTRSSYWTRLRAATTQLADTDHGDVLARCARTMEEVHGSTELTLGGWHGDWGPWNMGMGAGVLQLWDWERHDSDVPLGFDAVHLAAQRVRALHPDEAVQERELLAAVPTALADFDVDPSLHDLTLRLYLLEIAVRYTEALRHGARADFRRRTAWVVALLDRLVTQPQPAPPEGRP